MKINEICYDIYTNKLEIHNMISERLYNDNYKYKLIKDDNEGKEEISNLKGLNIYINNLMNQLWEQPKLIYLILSNANIKDVKNNLAYFICNNFYENILNPNYLETNLLFVISLLLKQEINNLKSIKDVSLFLMETTCGFLLDQLKERKDIQLYFKIILQDIIEKIEEIFSSKEIIFDIKKIEEEINELKKEGKKDPKSIKEKKDLNKFYLQENNENNLNENENNEEKLKNNKNEDRKKLFYKKYMLNMTMEEMEKIKTLNDKNMDDEIKNDMKEFFDYQLNLVSNNPQIFENTTFFKSITKSKLSENIFSVYQNMFLGIIDIIKRLLQNFLNNIDLIPYSIKVILKIISLLTKKKFPDIKPYEENMFLSKFFINILLNNMLNNPSILLLINNIISKNTINNLKLVSRILIKFVSCKFYQNYINECSYIPFNWFFCDEMPFLIKFYKDILKNVNIPPIINQLINREKNLTFEYFKDKDEIIGHKSICYSYKDLFILLETIDKIKSIFFLDDKTDLLEAVYEKLNREDAIKIFETLKNNPQYEIINNQSKSKEKKPILKYFLISEILFNNEKLNLLNNKQNNEKKDGLLDIENTLSIKNNLCNILLNNKIIQEIDFDIKSDNIGDFNNITIFNILNKFKSLNNLLYYSNDNLNPENKNINWLIYELGTLDKILKQNDYSRFLWEIYKDKKESISNLNNKDFSHYYDKIEMAKKYNYLYQESKKIILNIDINNTVNSIIEDESFPVEVYFEYKQDKKELKIVKFSKHKKRLSIFVSSSNNDKDIKKEYIFQKINNFYSFEICETCQTINNFINNFPDIATISELNEENLFDTLTKIDLNSKLKEYFSIIENYFANISNKKSRKNSSDNSYNININYDSFDFEKINIKIKDFVMEKLYEKIYSKKINSLDSKIFLNCIKLSWTEPKHYLKEEIIENTYPLYFESFVEEMKILMNNVDKEKIPYKKMNLINSTLNIFDKYFCKNEKVNYDKDFFKCLLIYTLVKIRPNYIYKNCLFIKLFIENNKNKDIENMTEIFTESCKFFENFSYKNLFGVSEDEFIKRCEKSLYDYSK